MVLPDQQAAAADLISLIPIASHPGLEREVAPDRQQKAGRVEIDVGVQIGARGRAEGQAAGSLPQAIGAHPQRIAPLPSSRSSGPSKSS